MILINGDNELEKKSSNIGSVITKWWNDSLRKDDGPSRKAAARLRRCTTPVEAALIEEVHNLKFMVEQEGFEKFQPDTLALVAICLSHVKEGRGKKLAELFGNREIKDGPRVLSEIRFQSLIRITNKVELIGPIRRAISLVQHKPINVYALAEDTFHWNEDVRREWCFQYFGSSRQKKSKNEKENL